MSLVCSAVLFTSLWMLVQQTWLDCCYGMVWFLTELVSLPFQPLLASPLSLNLLQKLHPQILSHAYLLTLLDARHEHLPELLQELPQELLQERLLEHHREDLQELLLEALQGAPDLVLRVHHPHLQQAINKEEHLEQIPLAFEMCLSYQQPQPLNHPLKLNQIIGYVQHSIANRHIMGLNLQGLIFLGNEVKLV